MTTGFPLRATLALLTGVAALTLGTAAQAFTYDNHFPRGDDLGLADSDQSSHGLQLHVTGGSNFGPAPGTSPFLSSSNASIGSPVVPYGSGAGTMPPRFLYNH
ncbi:MAG TPA: hypothetical protein VL574_00100 [Stellaceae bacterium]|nr:hypothetical protein [Stellaceae bacterium]